MGSPTHRVRNGMRDKEVSFGLLDDALEWDDGVEKKSVPFGEIQQLNLTKYLADSVDPSVIHGQLVVKTRAGERLKIRSHHFTGIGSFENRAETYGPFVRELCERVGRANPTAGFVSGGSVARVAWFVVLVLLVLIEVVLVLALLGAGWSADLIFGASLVAFVIPLAWRSFQGSRRETFDASDPPAALLDLS